MLLESVGFKVEVRANPVDESLTAGKSIEAALLELAQRKLGKYYLK